MAGFGFGSVDNKGAIMAGDDHKPMVYVSYHKEKERGNNTLINLQDKLKDIPFKVDKDAVKPGDDFMDFIHEIGSANNIIAIFSKEYFESFWCMYELTRIVQHGGDLKSRVFIIRENDYKLANENNKKHIRDYWQKLLDLGDAERPEELSKYGTPERIKEIWEALEAIFKNFETTEALTPRQLVQSRYIDLLDWLDSGDKELEVSEREYVDDSDFLQEVRVKIQLIVNNPPINHALKEAFDCTLEHDSIVVEKLCTEDSSSLIKFLNGPLTNVVNKLRSHQDYANEIREALAELASLLIYFVVNLDWVKQERNKNRTILEIPATSELAGSAASAMVHQTYQHYHAKRTNPQVESHGKVKVPAKQLSWSDKKSKMVRGLIAHIYNHVFPDAVHPFKALDEHASSSEIPDDEIEAFNEQLLTTNEHYFLLLPDNESYSYLDDPVLLHELRSKLPALIIIKLVSASKAELVIEKDARLRMAYQRFLVNL